MCVVCIAFAAGPILVVFGAVTYFTESPFANREVDLVEDSERAFYSLGGDAQLLRRTNFTVNGVALELQDNVHLPVQSTYSKAADWTTTYFNGTIVVAPRLILNVTNRNGGIDSGQGRDYAYRVTTNYTDDVDIYCAAAPENCSDASCEPYCPDDECLRPAPPGPGEPCEVGSVCRTCLSMRYLASLCLVLDGATSSRYPASQSWTPSFAFQSCTYPFDTPEYRSTPSIVIPITVRSSGDPLLVLESVSRGTNVVDSNSDSHSTTSKVLFIFGLVMTFLTVMQGVRFLIWRSRVTMPLPSVRPVVQHEVEMPTVIRLDHDVPVGTIPIGRPANEPDATAIVVGQVVTPAVRHEPIGGSTAVEPVRLGFVHPSSGYTAAGTENCP